MLSKKDDKLYLWGMKNKAAKSKNTQLLSFLIIKTHEHIYKIKTDFRSRGGEYKYIENIDNINFVKNIKGFDGILYELVFFTIYYIRMWINTELGIKLHKPDEISMEHWIGKYLEEYINKQEVSCRIYENHNSAKHYSRYIFNIKELNDLFLGLYEEFEKISVQLKFENKEDIRENLHKKAYNIYNTRSIGAKRVNLNEKTYSLYTRNKDIDWFQNYSKLFNLSNLINSSNKDISINEIDDEIDGYFPDRMGTIFRDLKFKINDNIGKLDIEFENEIAKKDKWDRIKNTLTDFNLLRGIFLSLFLLYIIILFLVIIFKRIYNL